MPKAGGGCHFTEVGFRAESVSKCRAQHATSSTTFLEIGPFPLWNAVYPMEFTLEFDLYEPQGNRIKQRLASSRALSHGFINAVARNFRLIPHAYAQVRAGEQKSTPAKGKTGLPVVGPSQSDLSLDNTLGLRVSSIKIEEFPRWFRSSGRVYFTMSVSDKPVEDRQILYPHHSSSAWDALVWVPGVNSKESPHFVSFPVKSAKESWIPVHAGNEERYRGLTRISHQFRGTRVHTSVDSAR